MSLVGKLKKMYKNDLVEMLSKKIGVDVPSKAKKSEIIEEIIKRTPPKDLSDELAILELRGCIVDIKDGQVEIRHGSKKYVTNIEGAVELRDRILQNL